MPARVSMIALTVALASLASAVAANPSSGRPIGHAAYTTPAAAPVYGKPEDSPEYTAPKYTTPEYTAPKYTPGAGKPAYPVGTGAPGCYGDECGEDADYTKVISSTYVATLTTKVPCEPYVTGTETRSYTEKEIRTTATNYQTITHYKGDYAPTGYPHGKGSYGKKPYGGKPYGGKPYGGKPYGGKPYGEKPYGKKPYGGKDPKYTDVAKPKTTIVYKNAYTTVYEDVYEDVPTATGVPHKAYPADDEGSDYEDSVKYPVGHGKPVPTPVSPKETVYVTVPAKTVTVTESASCGEATPVAHGHGYATPSSVSPKPTGSYGTPGKPVEKPKEDPKDDYSDDEEEEEHEDYESDYSDDEEPEETGKPTYGTPAKPTGHGYATPSAVTPKPTGSYGYPVEKPTEEHDDEYEVEDPSKSSPKPTGSYGSPVKKPVEEHDDEYEVEKPSKSSPKPTGSYGSPVEKPVEEEEEDCTSTDAATPTGTYVAPTGSYATPVQEKPVKKPVYAAPSASATPVKTY